MEAEIYGNLLITLSTLISDFGISVISEISNGISGRMYEIWQQLVTLDLNAPIVANAAENYQSMHAQVFFPSLFLIRPASTAHNLLYG